MKSVALSALDSAFLFLERPNQPLHVGCLTELDGEVDFAKLVELFRERLEALPRFRQRPVRATLDLRAPSWQDDARFAVPHHVHRVTVPAPGGETELREAVDRLFSAPLSPEGPPWQVYYLDGLAGGRSALLWKIHHCMIDGVSGAQLITLITDALPSGAPACAAPSRESPVGARRASAGLNLGEVAGSLIEMATTMSSMVFAPVSSLPFHGSLGERRRIVWSSFPLSDLLAIRGAADCKVNDVVLAIVAGAIRRYLEARGTGTADVCVRAMVPVNVRAEADRLSLGNMVTAMFPLLPVGVEDPGERLRSWPRVSASSCVASRVPPASLAAARHLPVPVRLCSDASRPTVRP
jgi:WS/DGAT/MGAT family acyltransferase